MNYYEVLVADSSFKGKTALTYEHAGSLAPGHVVTVPVKSKHVLGVIARRVGKPKFTTRPLVAASHTKPIPEQLIGLATWITTYYPAGIGVTLQQFLPAKLYDQPAPENIEADRDGAASGLNNKMPVLTAEQAAAVQQMSAPGTYILHGETGSGKTRVYIELVQKAFEQQKSSIVLTPEIGLTPQLTQNFVRAFGAGRVITTHSKLTVKERSLIWMRMLQSTEPLVVLGPRSALFSPLARVGVIILDESHESSYKQEQAPHYHASKVAARLAGLHKAVLVLGSATPSISDYYTAQAVGRPIVRMTEKALVTKSATRPLTATNGVQNNSQTDFDTNGGASSETINPVDIQLIDLKDRSLFTRQPHISNLLLESIQTSMQAGGQSLVFLNRRGTARVILCESCGWQSLCPHCDLPLTYHGDSHLVRCHTCGYSHQAPNSCPDCGSANIILKSIGTKAIVEELARAFPQARIQRFDTDNAKDERLEAHYDAVRAGDVDIIVGTQLIAKGLDLPKLTTVGVVVADTSLYLPDYTAGERSYQLLRQVIGRVGRGHIANSTARVIIQTYDPDSPIIRAAAEGDWDGFYQAEIGERKAFMFPPFVHSLKIWCRRASSKAAQNASGKVCDDLRRSGLRILIDGPTPAFYEKTAGKYQWGAVIKAKDRGQLVEAISRLPANWSYDIDPSNLL